MVDTIRSSDQLLTQLFQDGQPPNSISPQDMRDMIISVLPWYGVIANLAPGVVTITTPGVFVPVTLATSLVIVSAPDFVDNPAAGELRYIQSVGSHTTVNTALSVSSSSPNQDISARITKDNVPIQASTVMSSLASANSPTNLTVISGDDVELNEIIRVEVANDSSSADLTVIAMSLHCFGRIT